MKAFHVRVAQIVTGEARDVTPEEVEKMVDMLLDTREGGKMNDVDIQALERNPRALAERVFAWSFGRALLKTVSNPVMAARVFLQQQEERLHELALRKQNELARERRERARLRKFQEV